MILKILFIFLFFSPEKATPENPRIYIIRHAEVDLERPGMGTSYKSAEYKAVYNLADVKDFNAEEVLQKIKWDRQQDTIFCSPQSRALKTAQILFADKFTLKTDSVLAELDYPVLQIPTVRFPVKAWLLASRITWMAGINPGECTAYEARIEELRSFSEELINYAHRNKTAIVVAHGMVNRELVKILKNKGWKYCKNGKDGYGNLSVNCMEYLY